eukprot:826531-Amorphochlora_amoeboformis.AAC.1
MFPRRIAGGNHVEASGRNEQSSELPCSAPAAADTTLAAASNRSKFRYELDGECEGASDSSLRKPVGWILWESLPVSSECVSSVPTRNNLTGMECVYRHNDHQHLLGWQQGHYMYPQHYGYQQQAYNAYGAYAYGMQGQGGCDPSFSFALTCMEVRENERLMI